MSRYKGHCSLFIIAVFAQFRNNKHIKLINKNLKYIYFHNLIISIWAKIKLILKSEINDALHIV